MKFRFSSKLSRCARIFRAPSLRPMMRAERFSRMGRQTCVGLAAVLLSRFGDIRVVAGEPCNPGFDFRVNAADPSPFAGLGIFFDAAVDAVRFGRQENHLAFSYSAAALDARAYCLGPVVCRDSGLMSTALGDWMPNRELSAFGRRFDPLGVPLDPSDTRLDAVNVCLVTRDHPSLAIQKSSLPRVATAWHVDYGPAILDTCNPGCATDLMECDLFSVKHAGATWDMSGALLPLATPEDCHATTPSTAYSIDDRLVSWVDLSGGCSQLLYRINDGPPGLLREHVFGAHVQFPCAASDLNNRFVVCWNEYPDYRGGSSGDQRVRVARVLPPAGDFVEVGATDRSAAVAAFDDGSFAVAWFEPQPPIADPVLLKVQLYSADLVPVALGPAIVIENASRCDENVTIAVTGRAARAGDARIVVAWESGPLCGSSETTVYREVNPRKPAVGPRRPIPHDSKRWTNSRLGRSWQHTAAWRPDGRLAFAWHWEIDSNVYGTVRSPLPGCPGDANCDLQINFDDIECFVAALVGEPAWRACVSIDCGYVCANDVNGDEAVNFDDIGSFVDALVAGICGGT